MLVESSSAASTESAYLAGVAATTEQSVTAAVTDRPGLPPFIARTVEPRALIRSVRHAATPVRAPSNADPAPTGSTPRAHALLTTLPLVAADSLALILITSVAMMMSRAMRGISLTDGITIWATFSLLPLQLAYLANGLYPGIALHAVLELRQIARLHIVAFVGAAVWTLIEHQHGRLLSFGLASLGAIAAVPLARTATRAFCGRFGWWGFPILILGTGEPLDRAVRQLQQAPGAGLRPVAFVDLYQPMSREFKGLISFGSPIAAARWAHLRRVRHALIAMPGGSPERVGDLIRRCSRRIPHVQIADGAVDLPTLWRDARHCGGMTGTEVTNKLSQPFPRFIKRAVDLSIAVLGGLAISPLVVAICISIKASSPGPVFYGHTRVGFNGRRFKAWKFRSMRINGDEVLKNLLATNAEARGEWERDRKLKNDPRVTQIGLLLRKTSLDELPQLWNVVLNEMSLVGPRPIVSDEARKYGRAYRKYKSTLPGLTGLWQVSGRSRTTYQDRVALDEYYVQNWSPWLDLYILAKTVRAVLCTRGAC